MSLISQEMFLADSMEYKFEAIEYEKDSYWNCIELDYGIEEYSFETVAELKEKIEETTKICPQYAKYIAVEAFKRYLDDTIKKKEEKQEISLPDYVYRL